jgi:hypothetical protein
MFRIRLQLCISCILFDHNLLTWILKLLFFSNMLASKVPLYWLCIAHVLELTGIPTGPADIFVFTRVNHYNIPSPTNSEFPKFTPLTFFNDSHAMHCYSLTSDTGSHRRKLLFMDTGIVLKTIPLFKWLSTQPQWKIVLWMPRVVRFPGRCFKCEFMVSAQGEMINEQENRWLVTNEPVEFEE